MGARPIDLTFLFHSLELALNTAQFAKSLAMLGSSEDNTALSRALSQLAEVEEKIEQLHQEQANNDFFLLAELLGDYIRLLSVVRVSAPLGQALCYVCLVLALICGVAGGSWSKFKRRAWSASDLSRQRANVLLDMLEGLDWNTRLCEAWLCCCSPGGMWSRLMACRRPQPFQRVEAVSTRSLRALTP